MAVSDPFEALLPALLQATSLQGRAMSSSAGPDIQVKGRQTRSITTGEELAHWKVPMVCNS